MTSTDNARARGQAAGYASGYGDGYEAGWTAGRAGTSTATDEDALDSLPYFTFEDDDVAPDEEFVRKADVARLLATARPAEPTDAQVEAAYRVFRGMTSHPGRTLVRAMLTAALAAPTDTTKETP